jgi:hypothetical protein
MLSSFGQKLLDSVFQKLETDTTLTFQENELKKIPKINTKIKPPENFVISEEIPGLVHPISSSTFEFQEIFGIPYVMFNEAILKEDYKKQNGTLLESREVKLLNETMGILYLFEYKIEDRVYERLTFLTGDYNTTIWVNVSFLQSYKNKIEYIAIKSLLTIQHIKI